MFNIDDIFNQTKIIKTKTLENWKTLKLDDMQERIKEFEKRMSASSFWDNAEEANKVSKEFSNFKKIYSEWKNLVDRLESLLEFIQFAKTENDSTLYTEIEQEFNALVKVHEDKELYLYFRKKFDDASAYLSINAGAGGTESCDWASMLLRMYLRWAELEGYETEVIDELPGEEAGIKNTTIFIKGLYAYGKLKGEAGVHRLVRISPFDSNAKRHTSFVSVSLFPEIEEDIEIEINPVDLKVDTYRAGGAGGQHVNKTESAIRITHMPTGLIVACQQDRSQHKNREIAMNMLKAKLYQHYERQKNEEHKKIQGDKKEIAWGSQIRSYVFQPYSLIKDHRTGHETGNIQKIMDGYINEFIFEYLKWHLKNTNS